MKRTDASEVMLVAGLSVGTKLNTIFQTRGLATSGGAHTTPHGLGRIPTFFQVAIDGMPAGALAISAVSVDATNVNWTDSAAGGTVTILAF